MSWKDELEAHLDGCRGPNVISMARHRMRRGEMYVIHDTSDRLSVEEIDLFLTELSITYQQGLVHVPQAHNDN